MTPSIIIADDHSMIRKGIKLLLNTKLGYKEVVEADTCNALMNELKKAHYSHLILDIIFPDGTSLELVPNIKRLYPDVKIMIFSMQPIDIYSKVFRQYGIHYFLSKSVKEEETVNFLKRFFNNELTNTEQENAPVNSNPFSLLAARELEILHYLLNGYQTKDIAKTLNLGNSTVSTFKKRIFEKTETTSLAQLFEMASLYDLNFLANSAKKFSEE